MTCGSETSHAHACMAGRLEVKRLHLVRISMSAVLSIQIANHVSKVLAQSLILPAVHICLNCVKCLSSTQSNSSFCAKEIARFCVQC